MQCLLEILPRELHTLVLEATANLAMIMPLCAGEIDAMLSDVSGTHLSIFSLSAYSAYSKIAHRSKQNNIMSLSSHEHPTKPTYRSSTVDRNKEETDAVLRYDLLFSRLSCPVFKRHDDSMASYRCDIILDVVTQASHSCSNDSPATHRCDVVLDVRNTHTILCTRLDILSLLFSVRIQELAKKVVISSIDDMLDRIEDILPRVVYLASNLVILDEQYDVMCVLNRAVSVQKDDGGRITSEGIKELKSMVVEAINRTL